MKKKNRLQMLAALLAATLSMALTSPIAAKANEEYNVDTTKETNADTGRIYYLKNSHGDVIGQMDENGNLLTSYAYNAFGEQVSAVATKGEQKSTTNRFLYAGEQYDETSGLYYLRARHYDVKAGRFTQEDTYLGDGRNLYAYVHSNPLKYVDPTGHCDQEIFEPGDNLLDDLQEKSEGGTGANGSAIPGGSNSLNTGNGNSSSINSKVTDPLTGTEVGRFIADDHGNIMIEPVGGTTIAAGNNGVDTHTLYPNGSNYQRYNPVGHGTNTIPHAHAHLRGIGSGKVDKERP